MIWEKTCERTKQIQSGSDPIHCMWFETLYAGAGRNEWVVCFAGSARTENLRIFNDCSVRPEDLEGYIATRLLSIASLHRIAL